MVDCNVKLGKTRVQFMNYTTRSAFASRLPIPTTARAFNCIQVAGSKIYGCRPAEGLHQAERRHTLHAQRQLVLNLCNRRRALIAVTLQQWSRSSSVLWRRKRSRMRFQLSYGCSASMAMSTSRVAECNRQQILY